MSTDPNRIAQSSDLDALITGLVHNRQRWARTSTEERIRLLEEIKTCLMAVADEWVDTASDQKEIPAGSSLRGEEWMSGPYTLMSACNGLIATLSQMEGKKFLDDLPAREIRDAQIAVRVIPHSILDRLLLSGITADIWMKAGISIENLADNTASAYDIPPSSREGSVGLVLGAGNIASIAPLDCFQKLFLEHSVVVLKLNPVNAYLESVLCRSLQPLIDFGALAIVTGGIETGEYLCNHPEVETLHITGAETSHDAIVWGVGDEAVVNKKAGKPKNTRRITSELGAVCPTIVVPGPWTAADIRFQAEHVTTQKLHNSGFNCVACQVLVLPQEWEQRTEFVDTLKSTMEAAPKRGLYYPGADGRIDAFVAAYPDAETIGDQSNAPRRMIASIDAKGPAQEVEVFAPVLGITKVSGDDAEEYLSNAIAYCNEQLHGTLGANILIHPATRRQLAGKWIEIIGDLKYGCIAINAWTGLGFLSTQTPWGAFPGHTLDDVQSGIGFVHNTYMFDQVERTVVEAPFRPFPRSLIHGSFALLPKPPWFVTNRKADILGRLLTDFQYRPGLRKLFSIFLSAVQG